MIKKNKEYAKVIFKYFLIICLLVCSFLHITVEVDAASNPYQQDGGHGIVSGNCTYTAWEQAYNRMGIALPAWGNAGQWYGNAAASGYQVIPYSPGVVPPANSIACWSGGYGHVAYVIDADSVGMVLYESNIDIDNSGNYLKDYQQWWSYSSWRRTNLQGFICLQPSDATPPTISNVRVTNLTDKGYTVTCTVTDNVGVSKVQFPTWRADGTSDGCIWYEGVQNGNEWSFTFSDADIEENYITHIYAWDAANNQTSANAGMTYVDQTPPVISNVKISQITSEGYTVSCTVTDNYKLNRVQFPTWTIVNDQDDIASEWWNNSAVTGKQNGNTWTFEVKRSDHGGEYGTYWTHIYAYDENGNCTFYNVAPKVELKATIKGDIDGDGTVTIFDAGLIIDMVYGRTEPDISLADLDGDGSVTIFDAGAAIDLVYGR